MIGAVIGARNAARVARFKPEHAQGAAELLVKRVARNPERNDQQQSAKRGQKPSFAAKTANGKINPERGAGHQPFLPRLEFMRRGQVARAQVNPACEERDIERVAENRATEDERPDQHRGKSEKDERLDERCDRGVDRAEDNGADRKGDEKRTKDNRDESA